MNVSVYTTPTCPYCKKVKTFFEDNDVDFEEFNVADNQEKAKEMIEKSGQRGVPVTVIEDDGDEEIIVGFNEEKLSEELDL